MNEDENTPIPGQEGLPGMPPPVEPPPIVPPQAPPRAQTPAAEPAASAPLPAQPAPAVASPAEPPQPEAPETISAEQPGYDTGSYAVSEPSSQEPSAPTAYERPAPETAASPSRRGSRPQTEPGERRKGRGTAGWVIALIGVLLLCCVFSSCWALAGGLSLFNPGKAKAADALKQADAHWNKALVAVDKMGEVIKQTRNIDPKSPSKAVTSVVKPARANVAAARNQLAQARSVMTPLRQSKMRSSYLLAIAEADQALARSDGLLGYLDQIGKLYELVLNGAARVKAGAASLEAAVNAVNKNDYSATLAAANKADTEFSKARDLFAQGAKLDKDAGFGKALTYVNKLDDEASVLGQLAQAGKANDISKYNSLAAKQRSLQGQIAGLPLPDLVTNQNWAQATIQRYTSAIEEHAKKADTLQKAAHKAFDAGQY